MDEVNLHILLVEDNPADAYLVQEALAQVDCQPAITHLKRMEEALEYLKQGGPVDCILLDLDLPDSHGLATLQQALSAAPCLPIIVLTGMEDESLGTEVVRNGAQVYLVKGQTPPRMLMRAIHHAVERKRTEEALRESRARLAILAEASFEGIVESEAGRIVDCNEQLARMLGYSVAELRGAEIANLIAPEDRERVMANIRQGRGSAIEHAVLRKDGSRIVVETHGRPVSPDSARRHTAIRDITERKQVEEALLEAKAAAEAANVAKSQFLANMSHELRTPMNAILGMIEVALPKAADPTVQDCLQTARDSADLLLTLLDDLLDSAKIESGKLELESAPFSLRRMLDQITRVLSVRASEKGLAFYCRMPEGTPDAVTGDRMRLQQVLLNLAGNAIKFTERGEVEIALRVLPSPACRTRQDGRGAERTDHALATCPHPSPHPSSLVALEFTVRDTGIGIPPSSLERVFLPFAQADASMTRRFGGTGLGLSICKSLVEMMGGRIWAESAAGEGSTFCFTVCLPLAEELPSDFDPPVMIAAAASGQLRILLVEDNPANQKLATYVLQDRGHVVEIAGDGQAAIYLTQQKCYDVILMDVQMPGMNGLEATAAIRAREHAGGEGGGNRVPIIAMTAHAMKGDREQCLAAGMDAYLSKPIDGQELIALVETLATASSPAAVVFDPELALELCSDSRDLLRDMIQCFFDDVEDLFPQMRAALERADLVKIGQMGHRMKGTLIHLGARPAEEASLGVERFCTSNGGTPAEAEEAVNALQHQCLRLKAALAEHPLAAKPKQAD